MIDLFTPQPDFAIHAKENNSDSQAILEANRKRFSKNCQTIFLYLMEGHILNSVSCVQKFGIIDFRRRRKDLEENGVAMRWEKSNLGKGLRDWYMSFEDKQLNQKFI